MWKIVEYGLGIVDKGMGLLKGKQEADTRAEYREAGRNEQKSATLEAREGQASDANAIEEGVRRLDDDALDRELRGKPAKPG